MTAMGEVLVGTCGYGYYDPGAGWKDEYEGKLAAFAAEFDALEVNRTFYELPQVRTTERWRREAGEEFVFTMKAWQAITHPRSSPTWNNHRDALPDDGAVGADGADGVDGADGADGADEADIGYFRPTDTVLDAWAATRERATALEADVCVFQTPASFDRTEIHESNLRGFLSRIDRGDLTLAWEPRGDWWDHPEAVEDICETHDLVHVTDVFRSLPRDDGTVGYTRLHGRTENLHDYDYDYDEEELATLAGQLRNLAEDRERVYCMFNNYEKFENASHLADILIEE